MKPVEITVNIPFGISNGCTLCPHGSRPGQSAPLRHAYMQALVREIETAAPDFEGQCVQSVHLTGGVSAAVEGQDIDAVLTALHRRFAFAPDAQTVITAYPGTVNVPTVRGCQKHGVTAIDVELFSVNPRERSACGLTGSVEDMDLTHYVLFSTGFPGLAITLLYGMPGQTELMLRKSLGRAAAYAPRYLSVLPCAGASPLTDTGSDARALADAYLTQQGYACYAPGRYARNAAPLRCFLPPTDDVDAVGFGLGAYTRIDGMACRNTLVLSEYIAHADEPEAILRRIP